MNELDPTFSCECLPRAPACYRTLLGKILTVCFILPKSNEKLSSIWTMGQGVKTNQVVTIIEKETDCIRGNSLNHEKNYNLMLMLFKNVVN